MSKNKNTENEIRKPLKKRLKKFFKKENLIKIVLVAATLALVLGSVLPYLLI